MPASARISVVIITFNEEKNIARCIDSVRDVADEVVVVDSFSTDRTKEICLSYRVKFIQHPFVNYSKQKNFALLQATHDWVLSLDADEVLSKELQQSITKVKKQPSADAYNMNRLTNFCGKWIRYCGWYPDTKIRLFCRTHGQWNGTNLHETILLAKGSTVNFLQGDILHYSFYSLSEYFQKTDKYAQLAAQTAYQRGKRSNLFVILANPAFTFVKKYFLQLGILDGYFGFIIAANSAYGKFLKYAKLKELQERNFN